MNITMKILSIGLDKSILKTDSASQKRQMAYASCFDHVHVIVLAKKSLGLNKVELGDKLTVYPTNSWCKLMYFYDAYKISKDITNITVVTTQDPFFTGLIGYLITKKLHTKLQMQLHTDICSSVFNTGVMRKIQIIIARFLFTKADCIRVVSEKIKQCLMQKNKVSAQIDILPIFVDTHYFQDIKPSLKLECMYNKYDKKILVVSRLEKEKNVAMAVRVFAEITNKIDSVCLIIVGIGAQKENIRDLAKKLGIDDKVYFVGYTNPAPYYKLVDVTLLTSYYEGYGMVIIESLASGTPIICSDVGVARQAGAVVVTYTISSFAQTTLDVILHKREVVLKYVPYNDEDEYNTKYCDILKRCV